MREAVLGFCHADRQTGNLGIVFQRFEFRGCLIRVGDSITAVNLLDDIFNAVAERLVQIREELEVVILVFTGCDDRFSQCGCPFAALSQWSETAKRAPAASATCLTAAYSPGVSV